MEKSECGQKCKCPITERVEQISSCCCIIFCSSPAFRSSPVICLSNKAAVHTYWLKFSVLLARNITTPLRMCVVRPPCTKGDKHKQGWRSCSLISTRQELPPVRTRCLLCWSLCYLLSSGLDAFSYRNAKCVSQQRHTCQIWQLAPKLRISF